MCHGHFGEYTFYKDPRSFINRPQNCESSDVQQQLIAKLYKNGEEQEFRRQTVDAYFRLRMTWERAVEEVLLRQGQRVLFT